LKFSTNTALWRKQQEDIDLDCGGIVEGQDTVDAVGERIFRLMLATASGRATKSEQHGYGQNEFVPWQLGAVM
jgi:altronate hydrolase